MSSTDTNQASEALQGYCLELIEKLTIRVGVLHKTTPCEAITARLVVDTILPIIQQKIAKARIDELNNLPHRSVTALTGSVDQSVIYERLDELKQELEKL